MKKSNFSYSKIRVRYCILFGKIFLLSNLAGCQSFKPEANGLDEVSFQEFVLASQTNKIEQPKIEYLPKPGVVAVDVTKRRNFINASDSKNTIQKMCGEHSRTHPVPVLNTIDAPSGYGLDNRYNAISGAFSSLSASCVGGSEKSCKIIKESVLSWATTSEISQPGSNDGKFWNDTLTINMRLLVPMIAALGVSHQVQPLKENEKSIITPWLEKITKNFAHLKRHDGYYKAEKDGIYSRKAAHNHAVQSSNAFMSLGAWMGDSGYFNIGLEQWFITLNSMREDGSLPIETRRGARALFYQGRVLTAMASLAGRL